MPTTQELINKRQTLANRINELLNDCVDDNGILSIDAEQFIELQELQLENANDLIDKAEAIVFAIRKLEGDVETFTETINQYQRLRKQAQNNIAFLTESLLPGIINELGDDGRLPTPTFPNLRVRRFGRGRIVINDSYSGSIDKSLYRDVRPTLKDIDRDRLREMIDNGTIPVDDDGNPLATKTDPVLKATYR